MNVPAELRYTEEHEWIAETVETGVYRIGITDYAQDQLGDIVFVEQTPVGTTVKTGAMLAEVESTKSVGEVYAPFDGEITAINQTVVDSPESVNSDPYGAGWLVEMRAADHLPQTLDASAYQDLIDG